MTRDEPISKAPMPRETKVERLRLPDLRAPSTSSDAVRQPFKKLTLKFYLGRLPTFLDVQESPFDKTMYTPADADKFLMQTENTIRWRMNDKVIERLDV